MSNSPPPARARYAPPLSALKRDYLTGFHKRKQARRRFGLAMQEIKDRKERLEERKEVRERATCMLVAAPASRGDGAGCARHILYIYTTNAGAF